MKSFLPIVSLPLFALLLTGCEAKPRNQFVQWVARDAWNAECAEKALVEIWKTDSAKSENGKFTVDVQATFKLGNDCGGMEAYSAHKFQKTLTMQKCKSAGKSGWALEGSNRCWTGPRLAN